MSQRVWFDGSAQEQSDSEAKDGGVDRSVLGRRPAGGLRRTDWERREAGSASADGPAGGRQDLDDRELGHLGDGAGYDLYNRRALVNTWAILMGFCTLEAFATVGQSFTVTGTGSMLASVRMSGHYEGQVHALVAASSSVSIELHVKDMTALTEWSTVIANPSCGAACFIDPNSDFDKSVVAKFDAGHWYIVFLYIYAKASLYAFFPILGEAKVDFGPYDDDSGGGSWYNWFLVDFP